MRAKKAKLLRRATYGVDGAPRGRNYRWIEHIRTGKPAKVQLLADEKRRLYQATKQALACR